MGYTSTSTKVIAREVICIDIITTRAYENEESLKENTIVLQLINAYVMELMGTRETQGAKCSVETHFLIIG